MGFREENIRLLVKLPHHIHDFNHPFHTIHILFGYNLFLITRNNNSSYTNR